MMLLLPCKERIKVLILHLSIAKNTVLHTLCQRLPDNRRGLYLHISHPKRKQVPIPKNLLE